MNKAAKKRVRLALGTALLMVVVILLGNGFGRIWSTDSTPHFLWSPFGCLELATAAIIMFFSASTWGRLFPAFMIIAAFKSLIVLLTGTEPYQPHRAVPFQEGIAMLVFFAISIAVTWRFFKHSPTLFDSAAVTLFVFSLVWHAQNSAFSLTDISQMAGLIAVVAAWALTGGNTTRNKNENYTRPLKKQIAG